MECNEILAACKVSLLEKNSKPENDIITRTIPAKKQNVSKQHQNCMHLLRFPLWTPSMFRYGLADFFIYPSYNNTQNNFTKQYEQTNMKHKLQH